MSRTLRLINSFWLCSLNSIWTFPPQSLLITKYIPSIVKTVQLSVIQEEFIVPTSNTYTLLCQIDTTTLIDRIPCWLLVVFYLDRSPVESLISDLLSKYLLDSTQSTFNIFTDCFYDWCVCFVYVYMCLLWQNMSVRQLKGWEIYAECYFHSPSTCSDDSTSLDLLCGLSTMRSMWPRLFSWQWSEDKEERQQRDAAKLQLSNMHLK